ncbi:MAG: hypothetical protein GYA76_03360, partial [Verrucomicrobia bacterium]|nr:hypothetical protein [Verrucomicrobiota bacterium]
MSPASAWLAFRGWWAAAPNWFTVPVGHMQVAQLLHEQHYSLQSNRKPAEGEDHPERDAQFAHINRCVKRALAAGYPVISADTKKKELVSNYANDGQQWRVAKQPRAVKGHAFPGPGPVHRRDGGARVPVRPVAQRRFDPGSGLVRTRPPRARGCWRVHFSPYRGLSSGLASG